MLSKQLNTTVAFRPNLSKRYRKSYHEIVDFCGLLDGAKYAGPIMFAMKKLLKNHTNIFNGCPYLKVNVIPT